MSSETTATELACRGWKVAEATLLQAESAETLVTHWFLTPTDAEVHVDEHFGDNTRTARFLRVVVPTLADQLDASMLWVGVPWDLEREKPLMLLLAGVRGQPPVLEARALHRSAGASQAPWWLLGEHSSPPGELLELAARMRL